MIKRGGGRWDAYSSCLFTSSRSALRGLSSTRYFPNFLRPRGQLPCLSRCRRTKILIGRGLSGLTIAIAVALPGAADAPRSAIPWLSQSIRESRPIPQDPTWTAVQPPPETLSPFTTGEIVTTRLDDPIKDGIGILGPQETGFPEDIWGKSSALRVRRLLGEHEATGVPTARNLYRNLLLSRTTAPLGSGPGNTVLLTRLDQLMRAGLLQDADALIARAGTDTPGLFRRDFDIGLLSGRSDRACDHLRDSPSLSPTLSDRKSVV